MCVCVRVHVCVCECVALVYQQQTLHVVRLCTCTRSIGVYLWLTPVEFEVLYDEREALDLLDLTLVLVHVGQRAFSK